MDPLLDAGGHRLHDRGGLSSAWASKKKQRPVTGLGDGIDHFLLMLVESVSIDWMSIEWVSAGLHTAISPFHPDTHP